MQPQVFVYNMNYAIRWWTSHHPINNKKVNVCVRVHNGRVIVIFPSLFPRPLHTYRLTHILQSWRKILYCGGRRLDEEKAWPLRVHWINYSEPYLLASIFVCTQFITYCFFTSPPRTFHPGISAGQVYSGRRKCTVYRAKSLYHFSAAAVFTSYH